MIKLTYILSILAVGLIIFNLIKVDWSNPFNGDSMVAGHFNFSECLLHSTDGDFASFDTGKKIS